MATVRDTGRGTIYYRDIPSTKNTLDDSTSKGPQ